MKHRLLILPIDDITRLFADYLEYAGFPWDGVCTMLRPDPATGSLIMTVESDTWEGVQPDEPINFDLKQTHLVS